VSGSALVVLTGSLGDVVRGLPVASALKRGGFLRVGWVVEERWRPIVDAHPAVDRVLPFERGRPVGGALRLLRALRSERWDVSLDLQRLFKSGLVGLLSRSPRRLGFPPGESREVNRLFQTEHVDPAPVPSKLDRYLSFARHLGLEVPEPEFGLAALPAADEPSLAPGEGPVLALVLGSSRPSKDWPVGRAVELVRLAAPRARVVLVGAGSRRDSAAVAAAAPGRVTDRVGRTSLPQLAAVLAAATVAAGPDSGPGHLAAALGTPYVGRFGPTDPAWTGPFGCEALAVRSPVPCLGCPGRRCRRREGSCVASIAAEAVWERIEPLLGGPGPHAVRPSASRAAATSGATPAAGS
jgi:ADP-heptose:LPS heptosyltransferase